MRFVRALRRFQRDSTIRLVIRTPGGAGTRLAAQDVRDVSHGPRWGLITALLDGQGLTVQCGFWTGLDARLTSPQEHAIHALRVVSYRIRYCLGGIYWSTLR